MKPEAMKKMTDEIREKLLAKFAGPAMQETIAQIRAASAEDTGTFEVVISTADVDRQGESVDQAGWDLSFYKNNPVVLWGHDYYSPPIGVCDEIGVQDGKLIAKGRFAPADANPFAQQVRKLYDSGMVRTTSVGFIAREMEGSTITKAELLEFSFVPVPANPYAVSLRQMSELGIDREELAFKGIQFSVKTEEEEAPEVAAPEEEKGAVSDEIAEGDEREIKWGNLDKVFDILDAFIDVYLDEATSADQFEELLKETIGLLGELAGSPAPTEASLNTGTVKGRIGTAKHYVARKSEESTGTDTPSTDTSPEGEVVAEESAVSGERSGDDEGEERPDGDAPEQGSIPSESDAVAALKRWDDERAALKLVATIVGDALMRSKERGRGVHLSK